MARIARQTFTSSATFVAPAGVTKVKLISAPIGQGGFSFQQATLGSSAFFIDNQYNVWSIGEGQFGVLGNNAVASVSSATQVVGGKKFFKLVQYGVGGLQTQQDTYAIDTAGLLWGWGWNDNGSLGVGDTSSRSSPVLIAFPNGTRIKQVIPIDAGNVSVLALDQNGIAWSWGHNTNNVLGLGVDVGVTPNFSAPQAVVGSHLYQKLFYTSPGLDVNDSNMMFGLTTGNQLYAWGSNQMGASGTGTNPGTLDKLSSPTLVVGGVSWSTVFTVPAWGSQSTNYPVVFALDVNNNLYAWGSNINGQLGTNISPGVTAATSSPVQVAGSHKFVAMSNILTPFQNNGGDLTTNAAIDTAGLAWTWGQNAAGQLGSGADPGVTAAVSSPVAVVGSIKFTQLYSYGNKVNSNLQCMWGIDNQGQLWAWGDNSQGLLGINSLVSKSSPTLISFPGGFGKILSLDLVNCGILLNGTPCLVARDSKGNIYTWGFNVNGQAGDGTAASSGHAAFSAPVVVASSYKFQAVGLDKKEGALFAVDVLGNVYGWGRNDNGNLGVGDVTSRSTPTLLLGTKDVLTTQTQTELTIDVTPGASYAVVVAGLFSMFGLTCVGVNGDALIVEYEQ